MVSKIIDSSNLPFISIIIPVRNSPQRVARCIKALLVQTYSKERYEIIVVDNGSTDETPEVIQKYPVKYLLEAKILSPYAARNKGIKEARGEIIALIDANCFAKPEWLCNGVEKMLKTEADLIGGKVSFIFLGKRKTSAELFDSISNVKMKETIEGRGVAKGGNLFIRKEVFDKIGLFPGNIRSGGDILWTGRVTRAGFKLVYSEKAKVAYPARKLLPLLKKSFRVGGGIYNIWINQSISRINIIKRLISGFFPINIATIKEKIELRGTEDMHSKTRVIWIIAWLCKIASNIGGISILIKNLRKERC